MAVFSKRGSVFMNIRRDLCMRKQILTEDAAIVGTINMDYRSYYLHYENGIWMSGEQIQEDIRKDFCATFEESHEVSYEEWKNRPRRYKFIEPVLNLFSILL